MRVRTHLIAMPWAQPESPSIQVASLKAHLDCALKERSDCRAYSAFFSILHDFKGGAFREFFQSAEAYGEYLYQLLYLRHFGPAEFRQKSAIRRLLRALHASWVKPPSLSVLDGLDRATRRFLDGDLAPNLIGRGLNLVGFTLNFHQFYSSLYAAEHLRRRFPERHFLFVYGGCSVSLPNVYKLLRDLSVPGVIVVGEGEKRLELLVRTLADLPLAKARTALTAVAGLDSGIIAIGQEVDFTSRNPAFYASQFKSLGELALPDYDEYFATLRRACADHKTYAAFRAASLVLLEGSRGCICRCDFCALNRTWHGFRKRSAEQIVHDTLALTRKYRTSHVMFVDSICDAWAKEYARTLVQKGILVQLFMELRAAHREPFWTLLSLAGVASVQVGLEALSSPLLKAIGKGTTVVQNLVAQKHLAELGIWPNNHLITHHPASTSADVRETRRILEQVPHWGPFRPTRFLLMAGSPLYERLSKEERARLRPTRTFRLPTSTSRYALEYCFQVPGRLKPGRAVLQAWNAFERQHASASARHRAQPPRLEIVRVGSDLLRITDTRHDKMLFYDVSGAAAQIYDACHCGLKLDEIVAATGLSFVTVKAELTRFLRSKLVLQIDDYYLSLATRPRNELLQRFYDSEGQCLQLAKPSIQSDKREQ